MAEAGITHVGEFHYLHHQVDGTPYDDPNELANRVISAALEWGFEFVCFGWRMVARVFNEMPDPLQRRFIDSNPDVALKSLKH